MRTKLCGAAAWVGAALLLAPAAASAKTITVWAGGPPSFQKQLQKTGEEASSFFPSKLTVRAGTTVSWQGMSINFHSIDIPVKGGPDLPLVTPRGGNYGAALDAAGNPFWFGSGYVPKLGFNPLLFGPSGGSSYAGSARVDSGLPLGKPQPFNVKFLKPGTYEYFCDVHYDMHGIIVVKAKGAKVPTGGQVKAAIAKQVTADKKVAKSLVKQAASLPNGQVSVGLAGKDNVEMLAMLPGTITVNPGTTVTFSMSPLTGEAHTASFGPVSYLKSVSASFNQPGPFDPRALFPSSPPGAPLVASPTVHGNGFVSTGVMDEDPVTTTIPPSAKITFTTPGTYHFECLIHPFMHGTVVVK